LDTDDLDDVDFAEQYEGMFVILNDVVVNETNADGHLSFCPCGEFNISSFGSATAIRVDDQSDLIEYGVQNTDTEQDPGTIFSTFERLEFVRGPLYYGFSNFKLLPETLARDVGAVTNVATESSDLPATFELEQNFPNPFNPTTSISYEIPLSTHVTLDVYDSLGRRVRSLVNRKQLAGIHEISFDASSLASGVYLYKLTAGTDISTRTMILLK